MSSILVVIVTYNAMPWAERCFNSLVESSVIPDVFVIDNGSTDGTQSFIREHYPEAIFHQSEKNLGFGKANNIGLQYALDHNYHYVYLLNQDAWIMPDTIDRLIALSVKYPNYGILSPFQMSDGLQHIDRVFMADVLIWKSNPDIVNDMYNQQLNDIYPVKEVMAAHWFMTRECILKVGGFSPSFPHYGEDYNYTDRVLFLGLMIGIVPSLRVVHDREWRERTVSEQIYRGYSVSLRAMSNPFNRISRAFVQVIYLTIRHIFLFKSLRPLYYLFKVILASHYIIRNKAISMTSDCAFLD